MKYYNGCLFHKVEKDFLAQSGDPTGLAVVVIPCTSWLLLSKICLKAESSFSRFLYGDQARFFNDEIRPELRHSKTGTIAMASAGENCNASQFYITLRDDVDYLDDKHTVFGTVAEGLDTLTKINEAYVDDKGRPFKDIRIKHTYILDDPFDDPPQLAELIPENSPLGKPRDEVAEERLEDSWVPLDETVDPGQLEELIRSKEAHANAVILESVQQLRKMGEKMGVENT
ncbi:Peptidyl-prolyl cis-trans isomerase-like 4 [Hordeum vulgare]|nr:Peptidyl-prolyl cis-trans isomerase-like 4 [Hordeum vulgare]